MESNIKRKTRSMESSLKTSNAEKKYSHISEKMRTKNGGGDGSNKSLMGVPHSQSSFPTTMRQAAGVRCGELFVTNNAHRWTFFCTFCNKSTRDIGEFICHIKMNHLPPSSANCNDMDNYNRMDDASENEQSMSYDNSYLDYGNFLDVNVHTEPEELSYNGQDRKPSKKSVSFRSTPVSSAMKAESALKRNHNSSNNSMSKKRRTDKTATSTTSTTTDRMYDNDSNESSSHFYKSSNRNPLKDCESYGIDGNGDGDDEMMQLKGSQTNHGDDGGLEEDEDDEEDGDGNGDEEEEDEEEDRDYDNKLLIALSDSFDATTNNSGNGQVKEKRRQIRGTAYCELCDKTFQYYSLYRNHMIKHSNETPFRCNICNKGFKSKQAIRYHTNTHAKMKNYICEVCQAGYSTESQFITHVLTHEDSTTFPCLVCGKIMRSEDERYQHLSEHTEERPYRCEFCNKLFRLRHHLSNHLKLHRQYRCDYCKDEFTSSIQLRKPYACSVCQKVGSHRLNMDDAGAVHPLELYDSEQLPQPPIECVNVAEIITDSEIEDVKENQDGEIDDENDDDDDDDNNEEMNEIEKSRNNSDDDDEDDYRRGAAEDDDDGDTDYYTPTEHENKRFTCKECGRSYAKLGGLNFHIKNKHLHSVR